MKNKYLNEKRVSRSILLFLLLFAAGMTNGYAQGNVSVGNFAMHLDSDTHLAIVISCDVNYSCSGVLTIPSTVYYESEGHTQSYTVVEIAGNAFDGCTGFTSLNLPGTLISIGGGAFAGCTGFTGELVIPNSVTIIGARAFQNCTGFTGVLSIPPSVTVIENSTFAGCTGFSSIVWPENLVSIGHSAFSGCTGLTGTLNIPNTVASIGDQAFKDCSGITGSLNLPTALTTLGSNAFQSCSGLSSVVVPATLTSMGIHVFRYCDGLSEVYYNAVNCANCNGYWPPFEGCGGSLYIGEGVERIPNFMFSLADFTGNLTFPNSLTEIGNRAFEECDGFTGDLIIPNAVTSIGTQAFNYCTGFNGTLTLGSALTTIGNLAFGHCYGFTGDLIIPNSVTTIEGSAFGSCYGFTGDLILSNAMTEISGNTFDGCYGFRGSLVIPASVASIGNNAFGNTTLFSGFSEVHYNAVNCADFPSNSNNEGPFKDFTGTLYIGNNVERIPARMFSRSDFTGELILPNTVTSIGDYAFRDCDGFTGNLIIPDAVTTIGDYAFNDCDGFTGLTLGYSLTTIGSYAFGGCNSLTGGLTFGNALTTIGDHAFNNCNGFTGSLTIPNSVTTIGNNAFYYCTGFIGDLTIGNSVTSIGESAFYHCSGFNGNLTIGNSVTTIGQNAFSTCNHFTGNLVIPNSVTTIGYNAFNGCSFTGDLVIPNSVTTIETGAFYGCTRFNGDLTIGNSVTTIEQETFRGCNGFTGCLTIGSAVETIGDKAFFNCRNFSSLKILSTTPPTLVSNPFSLASALYDKPAYIPCGSLEAYQAATGWNNFTNYQEVCDTFEVFVEVVGEGTVSGIGAYGFGQTCTLTATANSGFAFEKWTEDGVEISTNATYAFAVTIDRTLTAHFISDESHGVHTLDISGYGNSSGRYYLIAPPIDGINPAVEGMTAGGYDLYRFEESQIGVEWRNYKDSAFDLNSGKGYLYAHGTDVSFTFTGTSYSGNGQVPLSYTLGGHLSGWNLVGNPYGQVAYLADGRDFYVMNGDGSEIVLSGVNSIQPMQGIFVIAANAEDTNVTFTTERPSSNSKGLVIEVGKNGSAYPTDRTIVRFGEGRMLPKLMLNADNARAYIPQGDCNYAVVCSDNKGEIPVNFKAAENGTYMFSVKVENVEMDYLHLIDKQTGADIDLLQSPNYDFEACPTEDEYRFKLVFRLQ